MVDMSSQIYCIVYIPDKKQHFKACADTRYITQGLKRHSPFKDLQTQWAEGTRYIAGLKEAVSRDGNLLFHKSNRLILLVNILKQFC